MSSGLFMNCMDYQEGGWSGSLITSTGVSVCVYEIINIVSAPQCLPCMSACVSAVFHCICLYVCVH